MCNFGKTLASLLAFEVSGIVGRAEQLRPRQCMRRCRTLLGFNHNKGFELEEIDEKFPVELASESSSIFIPITSFPIFPHLIGYDEAQENEPRAPSALSATIGAETHRGLEGHAAGASS